LSEGLRNNKNKFEIEIEEGKKERPKANKESKPSFSDLSANSIT
jgi:hypothetical protein